MNKKKVRAASTRRKRKVSKPRSNDSGVSLESTNNINVTVENFETNDSCTPEECNKNLKIYLKKEDTAKHIDEKCSDKPLKIDPISEKAQLIFIEDEPYLDYEPSEDEVNINSCAASNNNRKQKNSEEQENNSNQKAEVLPTAVETAVSTNNGSDCKLSNSIDSSNKKPDIYCSFGDTNKISEISNHDEIMIIESEEDRILEEDFDSDEPSELCNENKLLSKEEEHFNTLFHNAKVHFNGPLNITISRPITNNSQNQVSSKTVSNTLQNINSSQVPHGTSNVQIHKMSTLIPVKHVDNEKRVRKKKWPNSLSDISNQRITSNDNIFSDNDNYSGMFQRISAKLPDGNEKNTECTRESENTKLNWHDDNQSSFISNFTYSLNTRPNSRSLIPQYHPKKICRGDGNQKQPSVVLEDGVSVLKRSSISDGAVLLDRDNYELKEHDKEAFVARWLMHNNEDYFSKLLNSLCESHFSAGCNDTRCSKTHTMEEIKKMIQQSSFQEFEEYYRVALQKDLWFTWLFDIFIEYLTVVLNVGEMRLIDMINDVSKVFNGTFTDKTSYILKIIDALKKMGLSFKQAIKRIILRYGTTQLWICDILLFIIASESNLEDHWCLVQKITCCRKEKIDHEVVTELLMASLKNSPQNKELWKMIYQDIFEKNLVDLTKIPRHLKTFVVKMAGNHVELQRKVLIPNLNDMERSSEELFQPINPVIRVRNEMLSSVESNAHLQDQIKVISNTSSNSYVSDDMAESKNSDCLLNGLIASRHAVATASDRYSPRKGIRVDSRLDENKSWIPKVSRPSRGINDRVLRNFIKSLNVIRKPPTPANIIAHPSCQPIIDPLYQCNISLHNLLPEVHGSLVDISTSDLRRLKNTLRDVDAVEFLDILQIYSDPSTIESFIVNVLTLFKSIRKSSAIYSTFTSLLDALEKVDCGYMKETSVKVPVEVLTLNLFFMLNTKGRWSLSRNILFKMKDWHNLVTSKIYLRKSNLKSHMSRYIYIIKVLIRVEDFSWANEILQAEVLKLLGSPSLWPYECRLSDIQDRNRVVESFLDKCFPKNIFIANDLLKHIVVMHTGAIDGFDLWTWFNNMMLMLTKELDSNRSTLVFLSSDISNYYGQYMDKHVLQTYMLHMVNSITIEMALKMFKMCCDKGIYPKYTGEEHVVCVTTNLSDFEITSLLECYFENFRIGRVSPHDFFIDLQLPTDEEPTISEKFRIDRNVYKVFEIVCDILDSRFQIKIDQPVQSRIFVSPSNQKY